ncbi:helicase-exonuclease AddAB subunit AddB [Caryophanon tenue]|uniref:ATP-dependent helicase/deoxyribonuclease subunit B n=1 Tax=Caryophanon tenue TaxID=33978 RepID=A0A1C0YJY1_9BACL|nr:helicase-exonuclease AddAB subunit AddB [Caryophanon tenue]OCS87451.1 helicase-exonuclease AddAB subunit AddB [Caryophanon tenue]
MSLRIVSGRAGSGKSQWIQREIVEQCKAEPLGAPIFIIVPDQMSYTTEYDLMNRHGMKGLIRAQVLSFKRLAWYILQETGGIARREINGVGYKMLIRQLLDEQKEQFSLFRQAAGKRGFTNEIEALLKEFGRYNVTSEMLTNVATSFQEMDAPKTLINKTADLQVVVDAVEQRLGTTYVDSEGYYPLLTENLAQSEQIKEASIYIDGFTAFTGREFELCKELLRVAKCVTITLPYRTMDEAHNDQALFHEAASTAVRLHEAAEALQVDIEPEVVCTEAVRFQSPELAHIEQYFGEALAPAFHGKAEHITIIEAASRRAEIHAIAREIRRLATEEGIRYKDMAVLYRQAAAYDPLMSTIFQQYDIPYFTNTKKPMLHHPLIEFCRSVLEAISTGWKYEPMFRSVKTDLFFPVSNDYTVWRERADRMENFVISHGIYGARWLDDARWFYKKYRGLEFNRMVQTDDEKAIQQEIEAVRQQVITPLRAFQESLLAAQNATEMATALFTLLEQCDVYPKLMQMKNQEIERNAHYEAAEHDQAWNGVVEVLDQFVQMFGQESLTLDDMIDILDEGFDGLEFSRIPPTLDQVQVETSDLARLPHTKVVFVIGMNDGVYPKRIDYEGLLSDSERDFFTKAGYDLAPTSKNRLLQEPYIMYTTLAAASDRLILSYAQADEESKALLPSSYLKQLEHLVPQLEKKRAYMDPTEDLRDTVDTFSYLQHPRAAMPYIVTQLRQLEEAEHLPPIWRAVQHYYEQNMQWSHMFTQVTKPLYQKNVGERLTEDVTKELYGNRLTSSVSRIEKFFSCPFSHFATYGLKLEERSEYRLETFAIGDLFHAAMKWITEETERLGIQWNRLTNEQCQALTKQALEEIVPVFSHQILLSSARYRYIQKKLMRIVERTMLALTHHAQKSHFKTIAYEQGFGFGEPLPPLEIPLANKNKLYLQGRIDRIDRAVIEDRTYLRVVDYKSSARDLNVAEVYHGLSLQLMTYLDVAMENAPMLLKGTGEVLPAGVLYIHMHNPMLTFDTEMDDITLETTRLDQYRMRGLITSNEEMLFSMDETLEEEASRSSIIPVTLKKDGSIYTERSKVIETEDMQFVQQYVRKKHMEAGNGILAGKTDITPYRLKDKTACTYCQFKAVCQFDPSDGEQQYNRLHGMKQQQFVEKIRQEVETHD